MNDKAFPTLTHATTAPRRRARGWVGALLVPAAFFVLIAPTLPWLDFAGGSENLVVETVLEMRRGGPWFIPTLQGHPRLTKPPLAAWVSAAAARPETVAQLSAPDAAARAAAFDRFAWQVRWPTLLSACLMLAFTCLLGDVLFGRPAGVAAALICGSSLMFLRFSRNITTDVQLALWVTACNGFLALAVLRGRVWVGFVGAGAALGLALMSKGPVAFVQTLVPFAVFLGWRRFFRREDPVGNVSASRPGAGWAAVAAGVLVMLAIALPWPLEVLRQHPGIWRHWYQEVTREGATQLARDPWYTYLVFFVWMPPALPFLVAGIAVAVGALFARREPSGSAGGRVATANGISPLDRGGFALALFLAVVPIVVMSFFKDKPERYLLPMTSAAAVLAAGAAVGWFRSDRRDPVGRAMEIVFWGTLVVLAVGAPVLGVLSPRFELGQRWMSPVLAVAVGGVTLLLIGAGFTVARASLRRRDLAAGMAATFGTGAAVMLLLQYPVMRGYSAYATSDLKPLAEAVWEKHPDARIVEYEPGTRTRTYLDLPIYAGRTTSKERDLLALRPGERPVVAVFFSRRGDVPALPEPWRPLASGEGRKDSWQAFVLPAAR